MASLYQVNYTASEPVWGDVRLMADDEEEAEVLSTKEIMQLYPEYTDVVIESVEKVND